MDVGHPASLNHDLCQTRPSVPRYLAVTRSGRFLSRKANPSQRWLDPDNFAVYPVWRSICTRFYPCPRKTNTTRKTLSPFWQFLVQSTTERVFRRLNWPGNRPVPNSANQAVLSLVAARHIRKMNPNDQGTNGVYAPSVKSASPVSSNVSAGTKRKRATDPKFYSVRVGFRPGIYHTYAECLEQVKGFKKATCSSDKQASDHSLRLTYDQSNHLPRLPTPNAFSRARMSLTMEARAERQANSTRSRVVRCRASTPIGTRFKSKSLAGQSQSIDVSPLARRRRNSWTFPRKAWNVKDRRNSRVRILLWPR